MKRKLIIISLVTLIILSVSLTGYAKSDQGDSQANINSNNTIGTQMFVNTIAPQDGFDPLTATDSDLEKNNFPPRPTNKDGLTNWTRMMSHAKYFVKSRIVNASTPASSIGTTDTFNWAGYVMNAADNKVNGQSPVYTLATMMYTQPSYTIPTTNNILEPLYWTGIGGSVESPAAKPKPILQCGTDTNSKLSNSNVTQYQFWYQDFPAIRQFLPDLTVNPNDEVYLSVSYNPTTNKALYFFGNYTTQKYSTQYLPAFTPTYLDTSCVEYIYEPLHNNEKTYTNNVDPIEFWACEYSTDPNSSVYMMFGPGNYRKYNSDDGNLKIKAYPGALITNGDFYIYMNP